MVRFALWPLHPGREIPLRFKGVDGMQSRFRNIDEDNDGLGDSNQNKLRGKFKA
jgi:hypothetical protein